ncbi:DUF4430 domain-containing protein [Ralstonia pickettii]|nr:DUF4430 domain-containing protein [Ralstonia pickettii]
MVRNNRFQKLFMIVMAAILFFSQAGLFGLQPVSAEKLDNAVTVSAVKEDGTKVINPVAVEISDGDTAFDVIDKADDQLKSESYGDLGEFITGIGGVDADPEANFWSFYVNGSFQNMGASSTKVTNGDNIQFILTTLGATPKEFEITVSAVDDSGEAVIKETTVTMPEHTTAYDALVQVAAKQDVKVDVTVDSNHLTFLNYLDKPFERDCEFWATYMNGKMMDVGLLGHTIKNGDSLELKMDNWCEPEEPVEEEDNTEEPPAKEDNEDNNAVEIDYKESLQAVIDYITANPGEVDWYGFSALHSAGVNVSSKMAEDIVSSITDDYSGRATDIAKNILILTSAGYDATDINGVNLVEILMNTEMSLTNELVYSLLAIDSLSYPIPEETAWTRDSLVEAFLDLELDAGGWSFFGNEPSPDITGMGMLALSPYQDQTEAKAALDRAVQAMSKRQGEKGGYDESFNGGYSAESAAMVIIGLSAVGIDATGEAFTKSEGNLLEHLLDFQMEDGSFKHLMEDTSSSAFAINQGLLALVAYDKFQNGTGAVFKFAKEKEPEKPEEPEEKPDDGKDDDKDKEEDTDDPSDETNKVTVTKENLHKYEKDHAVIVTPANGEQLSNFEVAVDDEVAKYLVEENKPLVIDNGNTIVTIPVSVLKQLNELGETIELILVEQDADNAVGAVYDFTLKVDGKVISEFDSEITIELAVDADKVKNIDSENVKGFYYNNETEEWEVLLKSSYDSNTGFVTLTTTHFSSFGVFKYDGAAKNPVNDDDENTTPPPSKNKDNQSHKNGKKLPKTATDMFNLLAIGSILTAAGIVLFIKRRNKVIE